MLRHCLVSVSAAALALSVAGGFAHAQGIPYGCQINPSLAGCHQTTTAAVVQGSVNTVGGQAAVATLPTTGGGQPPASPLAPIIPGVTLLGLGIGLRLLSRR